MEEQSTGQGAPDQNTHQTAPQPAAANNGAPNNILGQIEKWFEDLFAKAPFHLPENWRHTIAKISPWITLIVMVLAIPIIIAALGLSIAFAPAIAAGSKSLGIGYWIGWVVILGSLVLEAMAIRGLFKFSIHAWRLVFYAMLLRIIYDIFTVNLGNLIGDVIGLYFLFEIKNQYH